MAKQADKSHEQVAAGKLLSAVPQPNSAMKTERTAEGLLVSVPMRRPGWLVPPLSWILPFSSVRRVQLDSAGSAVLDLCDGRRTVEQIIEAFAREHKLSFREAQLAVTEFLRQLVKRGIVAIVGF